MSVRSLRRQGKTSKGITLIALVITIIVLLILAAVSIAILTGENGILSKANTAKTETEKAGAKEKVEMAVKGSLGNDGNINNRELKVNLDKLEGIDKNSVPPEISDSMYSFEVTVDGYKVKIEKDGKVILGESTEENPIPNPPTSNLPSTEDTTPYLLEGATVDEEHNTLENGLVVKDTRDNEWVWIEVPKSIYTNTTYNGGIAPISSEDYAKIESTMQNYVSSYRKSGYTDTFYSTEKHGFEDETEYNNWKNSMLKSVYESGGFYMGRYEVGTETARFSKTDALTTPLIQRDKYPYNYVTCSQAQTLAKQLATGGKQTSLMFGIQWDLVMKFIEEKGAKTQEELKTDSSSWGNYSNVSFDVKREQGLYTTSPTTSGSWNATSNYIKPASSVVLTTGATDRNSILGIYDFAGNVWEWTLEKSTNTSYPCVSRGGSYNDPGTGYSASYRYIGNTSDADYGRTIRLALW